MSHFYLGHGLGIDSAEMPFVGSDIGEAFDAGLVLQAGSVLVLEPIVWDDGAAGYRSEEVRPDHRGRLGADDRLPVRPVLRSPELSTRHRRSCDRDRADDAALRVARRARVLAEMEARRRRHPRHRSRGERPLRRRASGACGPPGRGRSAPAACSIARRRHPPVEHLGRGRPRRHPPRAPLRHLVQLADVPARAAADSTGRRRARTVATDALTPVPAPACSPRRSPTRRSSTASSSCVERGAPRLPAEVDAIRASVGIAERALAVTLERARARASPSASSPACSWRRWRSQGVTTPATQDVAWITSRRAAVAAVQPRRAGGATATSSRSTPA